MEVVILPDEMWEKVDGRKSKYDAEIAAIKEGKVVFVPLGDRKPDSLRITLYEAAKRSKIAVSVRLYEHEGIRGFAVKAR